MPFGRPGRWRDDVAGRGRNGRLWCLSIALVMPRGPAAGRWAGVKCQDGGSGTASGMRRTRELLSTVQRDAKRAMQCHSRNHDQQEKKQSSQRAEGGRWSTWRLPAAVMRAAECHPWRWLTAAPKPQTHSREGVRAESHPVDGSGAILCRSMADWLVSTRQPRCLGQVGGCLGQSRPS